MIVTVIDGICTQLISLVDCYIKMVKGIDPLFAFFTTIFHQLGAKIEIYYKWILFYPSLEAFMTKIDKFYDLFSIKPISNNESVVRMFEDANVLRICMLQLGELYKGNIDDGILGLRKYFNSQNNTLVR